MNDGMSWEEIEALPPVVDLATAARVLRIGRSTAYRLAAAGAFPVRVIRVGCVYRVPTTGLRDLLHPPGTTVADSEGDA